MVLLSFLEGETVSELPKVYILHLCVNAFTCPTFMGKHNHSSGVTSFPTWQMSIQYLPLFVTAFHLLPPEGNLRLEQLYALLCSVLSHKLSVFLAEQHVYIGFFGDIFFCWKQLPLELKTMLWAVSVNQNCEVVSQTDKWWAKTHYAAMCRQRKVLLVTLLSVSFSTMPSKEYQ